MLFIAACEHAQCVADPALGLEKLQALAQLKPDKRLQEETLAALRHEKPRNKCFMQVMCAAAVDAAEGKRLTTKTPAILRQGKKTGAAKADAAAARASASPRAAAAAKSRAAQAAASSSAARASASPARAQAAASSSAAPPAAAGGSGRPQRRSNPRGHAGKFARRTAMKVRRKVLYEHYTGKQICERCGRHQGSGLPLLWRG